MQVESPTGSEDGDGAPTTSVNAVVAAQAAAVASVAAMASAAPKRSTTAQRMLLSVTFVYQPVSGHPRVAFHHPESVGVSEMPAASLNTASIVPSVSSSPNDTRSDDQEVLPAGGAGGGGKTTASTAPPAAATSTPAGVLAGDAAGGGAGGGAAGGESDAKPSGDREEGNDASEPSTASQRKGKLYGLPRAFFADFVSVKAPLCGALMDITVDRHRFVGFPLLVPTAAEGALEGTAVASFNIVFTIDRLELLNEHGSLHIPSACARAAQVLGCALRHEETRCGYLTRQLARLSVPSPSVESFLHGSAEHSFNKSRSGGGGGVGGGGGGVDAPAIPAGSDLASVLVHTFDALCSVRTARLKINGWLEVSLPSPLQVVPPSKRSPLLPFHSFLPELSDHELDDDAAGDSAARGDTHSSAAERDAFYRRAREHASRTRLKELPTNATSVVRSFLAAANPFKSFQGLSLELCVPLETLLRVAGHLIEWRLGRVVDTIAAANVYILSPDAGFSPKLHAALYDHFERFRAARLLGGRWSLPGLLLQFSAPRTLAQHSMSVGQAFSEELLLCVQWLLEAEMIVRLCTYVYLDLRLMASSRGASGSGGGGGGGGGGGASAEDQLERRCSQREHYVLFRRLQRYFDGEHTLEYILWRENLPRATLTRVLEVFADVITTCQHI